MLNQELCGNTLRKETPLWLYWTKSDEFWILIKAHEDLGHRRVQTVFDTVKLATPLQ